jgi:hypothetical protein
MGHGFIAFGGWILEHGLNGLDTDLIAFGGWIIGTRIFRNTDNTD